MVIYIGADHRGFELKESLKSFLKAKSYAVEDLGNSVKDEADDYPDFAAKVAEAVSRDYENALGVLICGSGAGMSAAADKIKRIRASVCFSPDQAYAARHDDHVNVLCLAADYTDEEAVKKITSVFLETPPGMDERYLRRVNKIEQMEVGN